MVARIACLALVMGILVGCYDLPQPECGFACGPASECPSDYSCNTAVNRCELDGTTPSCAPAVDAGMDTRPDTPDDFTPPAVVGRVPMPIAIDVPITTTIEATFSEPVMNVNGGSMTLEIATSPVSGLVDYDPVTFTARFQPVGVLQSDTVYTVFVTTDITDLAGNALPITETWQFMTAADAVPPAVTLRSPAVNATGVGVGAAVFVDFNEPVLGVSGTSFTVTAGATPVAGTVTYSAGPRRAAFTPATQLAANTVFTVSLSAAITDIASNPLVPVTWMFTTGADLQAPMVVTGTPLPASANVPVTTTVTATFDEPVINVSSTTFTLTPQGGSPVAAAVTYASGIRTATLTPDLQLAPNTLHTAMVTAAITDVASNPLFSVSWSFTTGADAIGPRIAQTTPADLATAVATTSTITVQFDEPVLNVTTSSFTVNGGAITGTIAMSAGDTIATFTPDAVLPTSATITVNLTTAITDAAANPLAAAVTFTFTTAP